MGIFLSAGSRVVEISKENEVGEISMAVLRMGTDDSGN